MVLISSSNATGTGVQVTSMPVLPVQATSLRIHTIVDHSIVETIVNNRTAMITNNVNTKSESEVEVTLFGDGTKVMAAMDTWVLRAANNLNGTLMTD